MIKKIVAGGLACTAVLLATAAVIFSFWGGQVLIGEEIIYSTESRYQNIYITRKDSVLTMRAGSLLARSSAIDLQDPYRHVIEYTEMMMVGTGYVDHPDSILIIGLGGGTLTKYLRKYYPDARIVNVEFDQAVYPLAREYFDLEMDEDMELVEMDGRRYLSRTDEIFDLIFLDAFHGDYIPFHLMTVEFLKLVKKKLSRDGVVVSNTWTSQKLYQRESATYEAVFGSFDSYEGIRSTNRIIVAFEDGKHVEPDHLLERLKRVQNRRNFEEINLVQIFQNHYQRGQGPYEAQVLTDDFAPVNMLVNRKSKER